MTAHLGVSGSATTYWTLPVVASWYPVTSGSIRGGDADRGSPRLAEPVLALTIVICFCLIVIRSKEGYAILARAAASSFGRSTMTSCPPGSLMTSHPGAPVYFLAKYRNGLGSHPSAKM